MKTVYGKKVDKKFITPFSRYWKKLNSNFLLNQSFGDFQGNYRYFLKQLCQCMLKAEAFYGERIPSMRYDYHLLCMTFYKRRIEENVSNDNAEILKKAESHYHSAHFYASNFKNNQVLQARKSLMENIQKNAGIKPKTQPLTSTSLVKKQLDGRILLEEKASPEQSFHEVQQDVAKLINDPTANLAILQEKLSSLRRFADAAQPMLPEESKVFMMFRFSYLNFQTHEKLIKILLKSSDEQALLLYGQAETIVAEANEIATPYKEILSEELTELSNGLSQLKKSVTVSILLRQKRRLMTTINLLRRAAGSSAADSGNLNCDSYLEWI